MASDPGIPRGDMSKARCLAAALMGTMCLLLAACATVNPIGDYERTGQHIAQTTGVTSSYQPGEEDGVASQVEAMLQDGLTAAEAMRVCLINNPRLQAAYYSVGIARSEVVQSGLFSNPSLAMGLRFPEGGGLANLDVGLTQNIVDLWQIPARKRAAEQGLDQKVLELARTAGLAALEARSAYYRAVRADRDLQIVQENVAITRQLVELAEARSQAGAGSEVDVNLSRSEHMQAELAVNSARLAVVEARARLATALGLTTPPASLVLRDSIEENAGISLSDERIIDAAKTHRLDIRAADHAAQAARARWELEELKVLPSLSVGAGLERNERRALRGRKLTADTARASIANGALTAPDIQSRGDRRAERQADPEMIIGPVMEMTLPIFDQNQAQIAKAQCEFQQAAKTLEALLRELTQEARAACERARSAQTRVRFYREQVLPLRERSLELSREAYRAGKASFLSVLEAERTYLDARSGYLQALESLAVAIVDIEQTMGQPIQSVVGEEPGPPAPSAPAEIIKEAGTSKPEHDRASSSAVSETRQLRSEGRRGSAEAVETAAAEIPGADRIMNGSPSDLQQGEVGPPVTGTLAVRQSRSGGRP